MNNEKFNKEHTLDKYKDMINKSWTYDRLTEEEKRKINNILNETRIEKALKGNFKHRWDILQAIYYSFLIGIGYTDFNWRENEKIC